MDMGVNLANTLMTYVMVLVVLWHARLNPQTTDAKSITPRSTESTTDENELDAVQTTPAEGTTASHESVHLDRPRDSGGCGSTSERSAGRTQDNTPENQTTITDTGVVTDDGLISDVGTCEPEGGSDANVFLIQWTVFADWRVLVGLAVFEVIVYVVTVTVVMVLHSRHRNQVGSLREGALTSKYQFAL
ncbi:uncharacterized protein LOC110983404 [Acanthaster planci]|uniref:Uncharacterized protein LOC110983404 n=1 Tax=Acanthaster planci TaxID=133434 RepID=A0A8B7Z050_ACAPL|nr:uncharacterized protein LOC110983404 [Acanthaster planci]